ncbi:MAG: hypothetical protein ACQRW7_11650 [Caulobacterales bacterium]|uniref:hypothetical protein n=1 Tax=Glycocaulis sp. TaxID=1969725 RepID=UPI003F9FDD61
MRLALREAGGPVLALFASLSTLVCCALPALLVTIGAGAVMAGLVANVPGLVAFTAWKGPLFAASGALLAGAFLMRWLTRNAPCPADPAQAAACRRMRSLGGIVLIIAAIVWVTGFFFAFLAAGIFF